MTLRMMRKTLKARDSALGTRRSLVTGSFSVSAPLPAAANSAAAGFTLLEVLVALAILAVGATLMLSLISGSLGNIRKVQLRTRTIQHAESVMELSLLDESIQRPTVFSGDFEDGTRWSVRVDEYELPDPEQTLSAQLGTPPQATLPVKLLSYTVEVMGPDSMAPDYSLHTLKLVNVPQEGELMRMPQ